MNGTSPLSGRVLLPFRSRFILMPRFSALFSSLRFSSETSSRSHSVFILTLGQLDQNTGSKKGAKLTLVDLAGSEKVGKTGAAGQTLDEAKSISQCKQ
jgi:hypothetical protein